MSPFTSSPCRERFILRANMVCGNELNVGLETHTKCSFWRCYGVLVDVPTLLVQHRKFLNCVNKTERRMQHFKWSSVFCWGRAVVTFSLKKTVLAMFSRKKAHKVWKIWDYYCNRFSNFNVWYNTYKGFLLILNRFQNVLYHWSLVHIKVSSCHEWKLPWKELAKSNPNCIVDHKGDEHTTQIVSDSDTLQLH